jgi:hypothetical protein
VRATYSGEVTTPRPQAEAFAYVADLRNAVDWDPSIVRAAVDGDPYAVGSRFTIVLRLLAREVTMVYEVVESRPPERAVVRSEGRLVVSEDVIEAGPGHVTYTATLDTRLPIPPVGFRRYARRGHEGLKRALA